jgi:hypothetical protein
MPPSQGAFSSAAMPYQPTGQNQAPAAPPMQLQKVFEGLEPELGPPQYRTMDMPAVQPYQPQQETAWQQAPEWQGYQTQMSDLQRQLDQSPLMQQMHALQSKMQGYQQSHAQRPQPMYQQPQYGGQRPGGYGNYNRGYGSGLAGLLGGFQFKKGGKV